MADGIEKLPRGIRNKNPGNIKLGTDWDGLAAEQTDPTFCIFDEAVMGIRALQRILLTYRFTHKKATIDEIIYRWAPPSENSTSCFISTSGDTLVSSFLNAKESFESMLSIFSLSSILFLSEAIFNNVFLTTRYSTSLS